MPKIPRLILPLAIAALLCTTAQAQKDYEDFAYFRTGLTASTGVQYLNHSNSTYWVSRTSLHFKDDAPFGFNFLEITIGPNYFSFNPFGFYGYVNRGASPANITAGLIGLLFSPRLYYPFGKNFEVFAGWDALKLTRMKDISSAWYLTGSLRAGFNCYISKRFFISGYYEFNHTHNPFTRSLNWALGGLGVDIPDQPKALNGHSVVIQIGHVIDTESPIYDLYQF